MSIPGSMTNQKVKQSISTLERRLQWLVRRVTQAEKAGEDLTFDRSEIAALDVSLRIIRAVHARWNDPRLTYTLRTLFEDQP